MSADEDRRRLDEFTDEEIALEVARRLAVKRKENPTPDFFCDACNHFRPHDGDSLPDTRILCARRHRLAFWCPPAHESQGPDDFGFYRRGCPDFAEE